MVHRTELYTAIQMVMFSLLFIYFHAVKQKKKLTSTTIQCINIQLKVIKLAKNHLKYKNLNR